ncbi:Solute carrier organic anion transporter family member [Caligus rogercresseyi]|uniref:Solute carrier organic anion transporter family member n=1 Tax=Caligus rogercresseyi TaxID=217165 RepID=A0A7T8QWY7_CALRO|nr:Solute carrier organic anion transporter family member [Caligus rogercresseyi]
MLSTTCGIGNWRPKWLQRFATRRFYISVYCIVGVIHGMLFSYFSTILSTIEKKFGLKSQEIAWVYSGNEISQVFFLVALPFMGLVRNALSSWGGDTPLWHTTLFPTDIPTDALAVKSYLCLEEASGESSCPVSLTEDGGDFGIPYIDDNSEKTKSPLALSFVFAARMGGPLFGSIFASVFLKMNEYPHRTPESLGFDEKDDRWIGAWWLGFFIFGPILMVVAPLLILFPEQLPQREGEITKESEFAMNAPESASEWIDLTKSLLSRLLKNKIYIFNLCSNIAFLFGFMGFITGPQQLCSSAIGIITSGWIISRYKLKARSLAMWCVLADLIGIFFFIGAIFIGCNSVTFMDSCESSCHCSDSDYMPICSMMKCSNLFSPCYAGCTSSYENEKGKTVYTNCSCISTGGGPNGSSLDDITFGGDGNAKYFFGIIGTSTRIPNLILTLRAIDPKDKASALTLSVSLLSLFAFLPATVVFGAIIDQTCEVWGTQECSNEESNCLVYDNARMRLYSGVFMSFFIGLEAVFDILVWYYSKDLILYEDCDNEEEEFSEKNPALIKLT